MPRDYDQMTMAELLTRAAEHVDCKGSLYQECAERRCQHAAFAGALRLAARQRNTLIEAVNRAEQRELDALAKLDEARALLRQRHGMECPTYDDATGTCGGCEVSVFLGDETKGAV